ncbi:MAG: PIG-L family deacetylase [bacterium]|nr:PIG-L family deacetylase [bacterium]
MALNLIKNIRKFSLKNRRVFVIALVIVSLWIFGLGTGMKIIALSLAAWYVWAFGLGVWSGRLLAEGSLSKFPDIEKTDRVLILAPHIDDEIIACAGIIQETISVGAKILIVYATNGDNHLASVLGKNTTFDPNDFIDLGEKRMIEAGKATAALGLTQKDSIFLGYPDCGLNHMLYHFFDSETSYTSAGTRFNYNPYKGTYREKQLYTGANLAADLNEIVDKFKPTIAIVPHPRDNNLDHKSLFYLWEKVINEKSAEPSQYAYLIHFGFYPLERKLKQDDFLYPPKKLFSQEGWHSFDLLPEQVEKKLEAVNKNASQLRTIDASAFFLRNFVRQNEIFEKIE